MATATSATEINFMSSQERDNFIRLTRLLIAGGTPILRNVLKRYHDPASLSTVLKTMKINFTKPQKQRIFPPGRQPNFEEFDISLIFKLLRNCCNLEEPKTKWNELPEESDSSLEANIVRIDVYRNEIYAHILEHMAITHEDFDKYWKVISEVLCRMAGSDAELKRKIHELRRSELTSDDRKIAKEHLHDIKLSLAHQDEKLDNIEAKEDKIAQGIEGLQDTMIQTASAFSSASPAAAAAAATSPVTIKYKTVMNFTINQAVSNPENNSSPQRLTKQVSEGNITKPRHQKYYQKTFSLPSDAGKTRRTAQEEVYPQFPSPKEEFRQGPNHVGQRPIYGESRQTTASRLHHESNTSSFFNGEQGSPEIPVKDAFSLFRSDNQGFYGEPAGHSTDAKEPTGSRKMSSNKLIDRSESSSNKCSSLYSDSWLRIMFSLRQDMVGFNLGDEMLSVMHATAEEGDEIPSQFYSYLKDSRQLTIKNVESHRDGCTIYVTPRDLKSLQELWQDYQENNLREIVRQTILPEGFEGEVDIYIDSTEYEQCCNNLKAREFMGSGRRLHSLSTSQTSMNTTSDDEATHPTNIPRSKSLMSLSKAQNDAFEELFLLVCRNGGKMEWQEAKNQLSYPSYLEVDKPVFRDNITGYQLKFLPNGVIKANVNLKFCTKRRVKVSSHQCKDTQCLFLHLCPYFLLDCCNFPTNCKNSHDISDKHTDNVFKMAKLSPLREEERLKLLKIVVSSYVIMTKICIYYNKPDSSCNKGSQCPYLHVCRDWALVDRKCNERSCKRAHSFTQEHEQTILKKYNLDPED